MKVFLHEIKDQATELDFQNRAGELDATGLIPYPWLETAISRVDEKLESVSSRALFPKPRDAKVDLRLHKVDEMVVIEGDIKTAVELICSRCATPFVHKLTPHFSAIFCKDKVMAGVAHLVPEDEEGRNFRPSGQNHGTAKHAHIETSENEDGGGADYEITYVATDEVDLGEVLTEQLRLQIPFQPLCKEACKGICATCGADLNRGRCACSKIIGQKPFSVLKDFKV
jgi:uncharacterized protein